MRRFAWFVLALVVKIGLTLAAKAALILSVAAISLTVSVASFAVPVVANAMVGVTTWAFGSAAVATVSETRRLRHQARTLGRSSASLGRENRALTDQNRTLQRTNRQQAQANRALNVDNRRLSTANRTLSNRISGYRAATSQRARRIGRRALHATARSIAAIPVEAVPIIGVSTIIGTTAWEIRDACLTIEDMAAIQRELGEEPEAGLTERACSMAPLGRERARHYGDMSISECRVAAEDARDRIIALAEQSREETTDLITDDDFAAEVREAAQAEYAAIDDICDCIGDLNCDPAELAAN